MLLKYLMNGIAVFYITEHIMLIYQLTI